ncbi:MAG: acetyl-CoA carboxylase biotin carboxylase subunit family protein [Desulfococcaceae bacterium]
MKKNIFAIGLDDHNREELQTIRQAESIEFHSLLSVEEVKRTDRYPMEDLMEKAEAQLDAFDGSIDAIIGFWDFPVSLMIPLLCERYGTIGPSLESVLKCEHKYWSRVEQRRWLGPHVPRVNPVNPFADDPFATVDLPFPFWLKPVKAYSSLLGFRVENRGDFDRAMAKVRDGIGRFAEPFNYFLSRVSPPKEVAEVDGHWCVAEEISRGAQCTQSGFAFQGDIHTYGLIDTHYYAEADSIFRFRYPSDFSPEMERKMAEISTNIMARIGVENTPFNVEYFYDRDQDRLQILEINPRISQSLADLYAKVDGNANHQVLVDIATGERPKIRRGEGPHRVAAKCLHRVFRDGVVKRVPDESDLRKVREAFPGTVVQVTVEPGRRLSELTDQDSYSYKLAMIYMGAKDDETLLENYDRCVEMLNFEIEEIPE